MTWKPGGVEVCTQNIDKWLIQDGNIIALISISAAFSWGRVGGGQEKGRSCKTKKHCYLIKCHK